MSGFLQTPRAFQERFFQMSCRRYLPRRLANSLQSLHEERVLCLVDDRHRRFSFLLVIRVLQPQTCFQFHTAVHPAPIPACLLYCGM